MNLIDRNVDVILTHRTISPDKKAHADVSGVTLIEKPIALDAFVFMVNKNNPVKLLTVNQVQTISRNSGSEEVLRELAMGGLEPAEFPENAMPVGAVPT